MARDTQYILTSWHDTPCISETKRNYSSTTDTTDGIRCHLRLIHSSGKGARTGDDDESAAGRQDPEKPFVDMICVSLKNSFTIHLEPERHILVCGKIYSVYLGI